MQFAHFLRSVVHASWRAPYYCMTVTLTAKTSERVRNRTSLAELALDSATSSDLASPSGGSPSLGESAAYQCRSAACLAITSRGLSNTLLAFPARDTNWTAERTLAEKGMRRKSCVRKERAAESGPKGRGPWLRMARRGRYSLISRNPPWLLPWTVPDTTLWVFPRCLALKNLPAVTLGALVKCGNSWPGGGHDGTERNPCSQKNGDHQRE
ncbi:hypothetical protein TNCV_4206781 [Trichonephila clavipes]|nr:hypothetical protein TNCV_4206781 [Trichonephila clavipes]